MLAWKPQAMKVLPFSLSPSPKKIDIFLVNKSGRGGVKDHLMLFRTGSDAPIPGDHSSRSMRRLYGALSSDVIMIRQFAWSILRNTQKGNL